MKIEISEELTQVFLAMIGILLEEELASAENEAAALRKALVFLIYLTQDNPTPACEKFILFLLDKFPSLNDHTNQNHYPLLFGGDMQVILDEKDHPLVMPTATFHKKLREEIINRQLNGEVLGADFFHKLQVFYRPSIINNHN